MLRESDFSALYRRCGQSVEASNSSRSALGIVLDKLSFEHRRALDDKQEDGVTVSSNFTCLECHNFLVFASSPDFRCAPLARKMYRMDIFAATGRFEVDPYIPIAIEYRQSLGGEQKENCVKKTFPVVPPFSSFKARQEDEDEDKEIDRILSEKLHDVNVDSRRDLRAKDPQSTMLTEASNSDAVIVCHIPEVVGDLSRDELISFLDLLKCIFPGTPASRPTEAPSSPPSIALSIACDTLSLAVHNQRASSPHHYEASSWNSHVLMLERCRAHTASSGTSVKYLRFLSHETSLFESK